MRGARPAAQRPRPAAGARGPVPLRVGRRLPAVRRRRRRRHARSPAHHPFTMPAPRRPRPARDRPDVGALAGLRPRAQRLGARLGLDPDPRARAAAADLRRCSASARRRPTASSGSSSTRSATARRRTAGSPSASTGWSAILAGEENIREVIAFPKTQSGADPMTNSPSPVAQQPARPARHPRAAASRQGLTARTPVSRRQHCGWPGDDVETRRVDVDDLGAARRQRDLVRSAAQPPQRDGVPGMEHRVHPDDTVGDVRLETQEAAQDGQRGARRPRLRPAGSRVWHRQRHIGAIESADELGKLPALGDPESDEAAGEPTHDVADAVASCARAGRSRCHGAIHRRGGSRTGCTRPRCCSACAPPSRRTGLDRRAGGPPARRPPAPTRRSKGRGRHSRRAR